MRDHRGAEGQAQVAEHVQRDLPLAFAGEVHGEAGGQAPGDAAAVGEERPLGRRARASRRRRSQPLPTRLDRAVRAEPGGVAGRLSASTSTTTSAGGRPAVSANT